MTSAPNSLKSKLEQFKRDFGGQMSAEQRKVTGRFMEWLSGRNIPERAPGVGDAAPDFNLPAVEGGQVSLAELAGRGPVVLSFFRGGWCPFCNLELKALRDNLPAIRESGAELVGVSPELPEQTASATKDLDLGFPLLYDSGNEVARSYGLVFRLPDELRKLYLQWGFDLEELNGDDSWELPVPATFVIDSGMVVRKAHVDPDYSRRPEPAEIVDSLRRIADGPSRASR